MLELLLEVDKAQTVVVVKRSLSPGFAGIDNPLFYDEKTMMLFADGKAALIPVAVVAYQGLTAAVNGPGLTRGMDVVVKGNERLYPGAAVRTAAQSLKEV